MTKPVPRQPSDTSKPTPASTADMTPRSRLDENSAAFKEKLAKFEKGTNTFCTGVFGTFEKTQDSAARLLLCYFQFYLLFKTFVSVLP